MKSTIGTLLGVLVLLAAVTAAEARGRSGDIVKGALGRRLDAAVRQAGGEELWGSVLVARDGKILLAAGYGHADYRKEPNTPGTLFELASVSKHVTAIAILHLERRGKLAVTDTLDRFFKDVPPDKADIQIRHLLAHTSGITASAPLPYDSRLDRRACVRMLLSLPSRFRPGSKCEYSNLGYTILAAIVEEASGSTFEKYVEKHLFRPAGMKESGFVGDRNLMKSPRQSTRRTGEGGSSTAAKWHWGWGYKGMGGVVTTVLDLHRWDRALRGNSILDEDGRKRMYTPCRSDFAYGWRVDVTDRGTRRAHHSGLVAGYGTNLVRYLEEDVLIAVLSNGGRPAYEVTKAIEKLLFDPAPLELTVHRKGYDLGPNGLVRLGTGVSFKVRRRGRSLDIQLCEDGRTPVSIRVSRGHGEKLLAMLTAIVTARDPGDAGPPRIAATVALAAYGSGTRVELKKGLSIELMPEDRKKEFSAATSADLTWFLCVLDPGRNYRPLHLRLNISAIQSLADALGEALE